MFVWTGLLVPFVVFSFSHRHALILAFLSCEIGKWKRYLLSLFFYIPCHHFFPKLISLSLAPKSEKKSFHFFSLTFSSALLLSLLLPLVTSLVKVTGFVWSKMKLQKKNFALCWCCWWESIIGGAKEACLQNTTETTRAKENVNDQEESFWSQRIRQKWQHQNTESILERWDAKKCVSFYPSKKIDTDL